LGRRKKKRGNFSRSLRRKGSIRRRGEGLGRVKTKGIKIATAREGRGSGSGVPVRREDIPLFFRKSRKEYLR